MRAQPTASHFINGKYVEDASGAVIDVIYAATGDKIAQVHSATPAIVDQAIAAAKAAQKGWARLSGMERGRVLRRAADIMRDARPEP
jgi:betaine-aldehyde dehydrogenase